MFKGMIPPTFNKSTVFPKTNGPSVMKDPGHAGIWKIEKNRGDISQ